MESVSQLFDRENNPLSARAVVFKTVRSLSVSNMEYYQHDISSYSDRFYSVFSLMHEQLEKVEPYIEMLLKIAYKYDFDQQTPGNGYRSFVQVIDACVLNLLRVSRDVCLNRESFLFRAGHNCREAEAYTEVLGTLQGLIKYIIDFDVRCTPGQLFAKDENIPWDTLREIENLNHAVFYGRATAFQVSSL